MFALLGWASLVLLPSRVLAACPMEEGRVPAGVAVHAVADGGEHAHYVGQHGEAVAMDHADLGQAEGGDHHAPSHAGCPDIAHCAVVALTVGPMPVAVDAAAPSGDLRRDPTAPPAPALKIETPPPRG